MSSSHSAAGTRSTSDRLLLALRQRVRAQQGAKAIDYFDQLVPEYSTPTAPVKLIDERRDYQLAEFLQFYGEDFIDFAYRSLFKREVDEAGLQGCLQALNDDRDSRAIVLNTLLSSAEGREQGVRVRGLTFEFLISKLQTLPLLGRLARLFSGVRLVGNLDPDSQLFLAQQRSDHERLAHASARVVDHLDQILDRLGGGADSAGSQETAVDVVLPVGVTHVALAWLLTLGVEEFLSWSFHRVLARQPVEEESALALQSLAEGRVTRTRFLGDLCRDNDVDIDSINVVGLPQAYRRERLFGLPLVGFFFRVPRLLYLLGHLEALYDYQASEVASGAARVAGVEARLMSHYNQTVRQVRRELDKAVREQPDQFEDL